MNLINISKNRRVLKPCMLALAMLVSVVLPIGNAGAEPVPEKMEQAKKLYLSAAESFKNINKISQTEKDKMIESLTESANLDYAPAQTVLGNIYYSGVLIKQDDTQALDWFLKAANQGNAIAQYHVGQMYTEGKGVSQSEQNAALWYEQSAEQGYAPAQSYLGVLYLFGIDGIEKNYDKAIVLLEKAAKQGDTQAINLLSKLKPSK